MEKWQQKKLSEICTIKYGKDHKKLKDGDIPVYGSGGIMRYVDTEIHNKKSVLIPRKGTLGNLFLAIPPFWTVDTIFWTDIDTKQVNEEFLFYNMKTKNLAELNVGTAVPSLTTAVLNEVLINIPPLPEQKAIADTLSCLDDKIELNNKINKNLEEQAQAIFKSWFVDFEPFQDGEFVDSELGKIPKGWRVGTLGNLGNIVGGSTPPKSKEEYYTNNGISWITPKDLSNNKNKFIDKGAMDITELGLKNSSAKIMPKDTVLFSSRAPIGYIAISKNEITTNQGFKSIVPNDNIGREYVYCFLKENISEIENRATGSTFKEVSGSIMKGIPAIIPDDNSLNLFSLKCKCLFDEQSEIEQQNKILVGIRDTLLPKLMSGEVRVPVEVE